MIEKLPNAGAIPMGEITFREATVDDADAISTLILDSQKEFCFHEYTEDGKRLMLQLCGSDAIRSYIDRGDIYYVAESDDSLVGVAGVRDTEHLSHNFVDKRWHRKGISNHLWKLVSNECIRQGNRGSFNLNASSYAIPVYQKWGFKADTAYSSDVSFRGGFKLEKQTSLCSATRFPPSTLRRR